MDDIVSTQGQVFQINGFLIELIRVAKIVACMEVETLYMLESYYFTSYCTTFLTVKLLLFRTFSDHNQTLKFPLTV
jgi:hypothetical protein